MAVSVPLAQKCLVNATTNLRAAAAWYQPDEAVQPSPGTVLGYLFPAGANLETAYPALEQASAPPDVLAGVRDAVDAVDHLSASIYAGDAPADGDADFDQHIAHVAQAQAFLDTIRE